MLLNTGMKNWKNTSLFGKDILDDAAYATLKEIIRTQNFGEPQVAFKGAAMHRQPEAAFKAAISDFIADYRQIASGLIRDTKGLAPEDGRKAVEFLKRCEVLKGMSQTYSPANEAFRHANVQSGKDYLGQNAAPWKILERNLGLEESRPERGRVAVQHLANNSFH